LLQSIDFNHLIAMNIPYRTPNFQLLAVLRHCFLGLWLFALYPLQATEKPSDQDLTINEALARALIHHPTLQLFDEELRMAEARILSASLLPNPELESELEDFGGSGMYRGTESATYNVGLSQLFRLGGKRRADVAEKTAERKTLEASYQARKRAVSKEVSRRFIDLLKAQEIEVNRQTILKISTESANTIKAQVDGGRGSSIDLTQAELAVMESRLGYQTAQQLTKTARIALASMWGSGDPDFNRAQGSLGAPPSTLPAMGKLESALAGHPQVQLAESSLQVAQSSLRHQQAQRIPDLKAGLAYRRDASEEENALVLGFSLPLPIFNRNQGGIAEAKASIDRETKSRAVTLQTLQTELSEAYSELATAHMASRIIATELLPKAEQGFKASEESLRLGRASYLQVLKANENLTALIERRTEAFTQFHQARISIEALIGKSL
jgi:cobalt-zinc-cadmium efflux system outer membrane protein